MKHLIFALLYAVALYADEAADNALFAAIEVGSLDGVKEAFKNGASADKEEFIQYHNRVSSRKRSPLSMAINGRADKAIVYEIFNHKVAFTPEDFIAAAVNGFRDLAEKMLNKGIPVDVRDAQGFTALMQLVRGYPALEDVKFLVERGADINASNKQTMGSTRVGEEQLSKNVLDYAFSPGTAESFNAADYLIDKGALVTPQNFVQAASGHKPNLELIKKMHKKIGNINAVNANGETALKRALQFGGNSRDVINYFLDNNANVNAISPHDSEPLLLIALRTYYDFPNSVIDLPIIEKMLQHGAQIDEKVMALARGDFKEVARLLGLEGDPYNQFPQPDPTKKEQVLQLLQKYAKK